MIKQLSISPSRLLIACLSALCAVLAGAQEPEDRWFRVELLVFSNESGHGGEQWEAIPALAYPDAGRFLVEPERVSANLAQYHADGAVDEFGRQILTMLPEPGSLPQDLPLDDLPGAAIATPAAGDPNEPGELAGQPGPPRPTPFIALPATQREFRGKAAYMQRSGRYRTLFHQAWVQPVTDSKRALPLILDRSGDTGDWPRLQGSVTLYLSRYLHLETNLWLNTQGEYLPGEWQMPAPPLGPPSLIIEELPPQEEEMAEGFGEQWLEPTVSNETADTEGQMEPEPEPLEPIYPWRHAVLLQQKRRMRSTEVHYLDHPMFGLVIKLTPLTEEDLEILAEAESLASPGQQQLPQ